MFTVALVSANGGAGKTALTANLASLLARRGHPVLAVDFDPNNLLGLYLGQMTHETDGLAARTVAHDHWQQAAFTNEEGVNFLPFGELDEPQRALFGDLLQSDPGWLRNMLSRVDLPATALALIDTPRLPSIYAQQALVAADLVITVLTADAGCYAKLPALRQYIAAEKLQDATYHLVNYADAGRQLHNDIVALLRIDLGQKLLPYFIHRDEAIPEALASNRSLADYASHSQAAHDLQGLVHWLIGHAKGHPSA